MEHKTVENDCLLTLGRSREVITNMLQEEARELYREAECIPGREWAEWFTAKRLSRSQHKT